MDRIAWLTRDLRKDMKLIEVGPSHSPIVPKSLGWNTTVVDYADAAVLRHQYKTKDVAKIEEVDVIWQRQELHEAFPNDAQGAYDAVISSHSLEHMPDPIRFFKSCEKLLSPSGTIKLALPDKRCCFDLFSGLSTAGDMLAAFQRKEQVHSNRTSFNEVAYAVKNAGKLGWSIDAEINDLELVWPLELALAVFQRASSGDQAYYDFHAWKFTPSSFALIVEELGYLGYINFRVESLSSTIVHEFFATLGRSPKSERSPHLLNERRLALLAQAARELGIQFRNMNALATHGQ